MSYRISFTSGSLIPSFCLSIKGRHDAPSLSLCIDSDYQSWFFYLIDFFILLIIHLWVSPLNDDLSTGQLTIIILWVALIFCKPVICYLTGMLLYHFVGHSFFGLIAFRSFSDIIKWNFSLTLAKLNFYVDMSVWLFVGKQYYRLDMCWGCETDSWKADFVPDGNRLLA